MQFDRRDASLWVRRLGFIAVAFLSTSSWGETPPGKHLARRPKSVAEDRNDQTELPFPFASAYPLRVRVRTPEGILIVYDALATNRGTNDLEYVVAWRAIRPSARAGDRPVSRVEDSLFVYDRRVRTPLDIANAVFDLERDLSVDSGAIASTMPWLEHALSLLPLYFDVTVSSASNLPWQPETRDKLRQLIDARRPDQPDLTDSDEERTARSISITNPPAPTDPNGDCGHMLLWAEVPEAPPEGAGAEDITGFIILMSFCDGDGDDDDDDDDDCEGACCNDSCCGDSCCGDPCCQNRAGCCRGGCCKNPDPCCGNPNPCCGSTDPCSALCGNPCAVPQCTNYCDVSCFGPCDDGNPCTCNQCDPLTGCSYPPKAQPCTAKQFQDAIGCVGMTVALSAVICNNGNCAGTFNWTVAKASGEPLVSSAGGSLTLGGQSCMGISPMVTIDPQSPPGDATMTLNVTSSGATCAGGPSAGCSTQATIHVPTGKYSNVELKFKTFIGCEVAGPTPPAFWLYDYFAGDNRTFGYAPGVNASRTFQVAWVTVDPANITGQVFQPLQRTGISTGYDNEGGSDVTPLASPYCFGNCNVAFLPAADEECEEQVADPVGAGMLSVEYTRQSDSMVDVRLVIDATDQCESGAKAPSLNADLTIRFRQRCENGVLQPVEFIAGGVYDGYPWFELYVNESEVFIHDPCLTGDTPNSMFPAPFGRQWQFENQNPALLNWQIVPTP